MICASPTSLVIYSLSDENTPRATSNPDGDYLAMIFDNAITALKY